MRGTVLNFSPFWHSASVVYLLKIVTVCVLFRYCYTVWCSSVVVVSTDDDSSALVIFQERDIIGKILPEKVVDRNSIAELY